jgi:DNA-binding response OmpR family regulator
MRVLVVEDVRRLADDIAEGLRDQGFAVDAAYDGIAALAKLNVTPYDVVVLDRDLPGVHGDVVCRTVTGGEDPPLVLMLTASGTPAERVDGLTVGADDYLVKPFHFPELVMRVHALARRRGRGPGGVVLRVGDLVLDPAQRAAARAGRPLDLSPKEFGVLETLLRASPAVVSAEELLTSVWDENADPFTKTVTVTVGRLRRKLGEPAVIETLQGAGYRIASPNED